MKPLKHQEEGIRFLEGYNPAGGQSFILADEMGLGKTMQSIISERHNSKKSIVAIPPASMKIGWFREILNIFPDESVGMIGIDSGHKDWWIVNYDMIEKYIDIIEELFLSGEADVLLLDEAQYIKGDSIRSKSVIGGRKKKSSGDVVSFKGLASLARIVVCLTGTPVMNRPIELFPMLRAIGHPLGSNKTEYAKKYCGMFWMCRVQNKLTGKSFVTTRDKYYQSLVKTHRMLRMWPDMSGATNLDDLRKQLKGWILRRTAAECLDLPEKIKSIKEIEMDKEWQKKYDSAWDDYLSFRENNLVEGWDKDKAIQARHLIEIGKLKQVCSLAKCKAICEDIASAVEGGEKVVVFAQYSATIDAICDDLQKREIGISTLVGGMGANARQVAIDYFNEDERVQVFVANIEAGGVGISIKSSSIVMFADLDWTPSIHEQAEKRVEGINRGTGKMTRIYYYVCPDTIEEDIIDILNTKSMISDDILSGSKNRLSKKSNGVFLKKLEKRAMGTN